MSDIEFKSKYRNIREWCEGVDTIIGNINKRQESNYSRGELKQLASYDIKEKHIEVNEHISSLDKQYGEGIKLKEGLEEYSKKECLQNRTNYKIHMKEIDTHLEEINKRKSELQTERYPKDSPEMPK